MDLSLDSPWKRLWLVFSLVRLIPGDLVDLLLGMDATPAIRAELRRTFGLDDPMYVQYGRWAGGLRARR